MAKIQEACRDTQYSNSYNCQTQKTKNSKLLMDQGLRILFLMHSLYKAPLTMVDTQWDGLEEETAVSHL